MTDMKDATEAINSANELAKAADPLMKMALSTFVSMVSMAPQAIEPALAMVPQPAQGQLRAMLKQKQPAKKQNRPSTASVQKAGLPWGWIAGGVGGVLVLGLVLRSRKKKK